MYNKINSKGICHSAPDAESIVVKVVNYLYRFLAKPGMTLASLFLITGIVLFLFATQAQAASLQLSPASGSYTVGDTFDVGINLSLSAESVDGVDALLNFDSAILQINSITTGTLFATYPTKTYDNTNGTISVSGLAQTGSPITTGGTMATITFQAQATGTGTVTFDFTPGSGTDSNVAESQTGNDILTSVSNGAYTISGSGATDDTGGVGGTDGTDEATSSGEETLPTAGSQSTTTVLLLAGAVLLGFGWRLAWHFRERR